ncbi:hypothetical protein IFM89_029953 [Coptis chinensis]|uniref:Uncharacterized protein n=1 Tax=Coptis chinensis TaxID=261450 RepID=A0A835LK88_9MAGN|nr:hypothetical protein IFM89_029953 [Coptis chinensis]
MALSPPPQALNQVCFISSYHSHGRSKAQMCLKKIIDFISSEKIKVHDKQVEEEVKVVSYGKRGCGIDLNLRLGPCLELLNNKGLSACSGVGEDDVEKVCDEIFTTNNNTCTTATTSTIVDKSSEGEYDPQEEEERVVVLVDSQTGEIESSAITNNNPSEIEIQETQEQVKLLEVEEEESKLSRKKEGYLDLLVEAARLISGNFENVDEEMKVETKVGNDDEKNWMLECYDDFEDISPVVRSKRGRTQVLPYRYRDSVLEPWKRLTKQRSSRVCSKPARIR